MLLVILPGKLKKLDTAEYKGCLEFGKTGIVYSAYLHIHFTYKNEKHFCKCEQQ